VAQKVKSDRSTPKAGQAKSARVKAGKAGTGKAKAGQARTDKARADATKVGATRSTTSKNGSVEPDVVRLGGVEFAPGERGVVDLFAARLYTHAEVTIPVEVVRGKRDGPRMFVCAALHGDEINGVEVIRRLLRRRVLDRLRGTLLAVPIVNVFGFIQQSRYLPDRRDLNRSFPGSSKGSLASRMARQFMTEVVVGSDFGIDLHTGSNDRRNLPQIRVAPQDEEALKAALAFGAPVVLPSKALRGTLRAAATRRKSRVLVYEGGEALRFDEAAIRLGTNGIIRVMREIGMLPRLKKPGVRKSVLATGSRWVRASSGGVFRAEAELGQRVQRRDLLGMISDPFGVEETPVRAPVGGLIIGRLERPLVHRGEALYHLAKGNG
jgi:predicted deacylase